TRNQTQIDRYSELLGRPNRTKAEEQELQLLRKKLDPLLSTGDTNMERQVEQAFRQVLKTAVEPNPQVSADGQRLLSEKMQDEIKRQLADVLPRSESLP